MKLAAKNAALLAVVLLTWYCPPLIQAQGDKKQVADGVVM
jgi:hypothetical protein